MQARLVIAAVSPPFGGRGAGMVLGSWSPWGPGGARKRRSVGPRASSVCHSGQGGPEIPWYPRTVPLCCDVWGRQALGRGREEPRPRPLGCAPHAAAPTPLEPAPAQPTCPSTRLQDGSGCLYSLATMLFTSFSLRVSPHLPAQLPPLAPAAPPPPSPPSGRLRRRRAD